MSLSREDIVATYRALWSVSFILKNAGLPGKSIRFSCARNSHPWLRAVSLHARAPKLCPTEHVSALAWMRLWLAWAVKNMGSLTDSPAMEEQTALLSLRRFVIANVDRHLRSHDIAQQ